MQKIVLDANGLPIPVPQALALGRVPRVQTGGNTLEARTA